MPTTAPRFPLPSFLAALCAALLLPACGSGGGLTSGATAPALGDAPTATLEVTNHNDDGPGSLRQAIADAPTGAWIVFDDALPAGDILLNSPLEIEKVLTIGGLSGAGQRHGIDGQGVFSIFRVYMAALQVNDMELHHGMGPGGGAIEAVDASVILWRSHIHHCSGTNAGGAISFGRGTFEANDCFFEQNTCTGVAGALFLVEADARIERCSFYMNQADGGGGGLYIRGGETTLVNSALHANEGTFFPGGAIRADADMGAGDCVLSLFNTTVTENHSGDSGGGLYAHGDAGHTVQVNCERSIVALNTAPTSRDTSRAGLVTSSGSYNIIGVGTGLFFNGLGNNMVGDAVTPFDPMLLVPSPIADGRVVSLPLPAGPAVDAVPAGLNLNPEGAVMLIDLRFLPRFPAQPSDIGAIEL